MKTKIFVATCLAFSVISSSCSDFLTEDPKGQMVQNNYFSSQNDLDGAVSVLYAQVQYSTGGAHALSPNWMGDDITALTSGNKDVYRVVFHRVCLRPVCLRSDDAKLIDNFVFHIKKANFML